MRCRRGRPQIEKSVMHCKWVGMEQHCKMQREKGPEAANCPSQTKEEGTGSNATTESATVVRETVRIVLSFLTQWLKAESTARNKTHCHDLSEPITPNPQQKRWSPTTSCTLGTSPAQIQQRQCVRPSSSTTEHRSPPATPNCLGTFLQTCRCFPGFGIRE